MGKSQKAYSIYFLIKEGAIVYIGVSTNVNNRIRKHRMDKDFDKYIVYSRHRDKKRAYQEEKDLINFALTISNDGMMYNAPTDFCKVFSAKEELGHFN